MVRLDNFARLSPPSPATHTTPEITLWRGWQSHILLSTWVPEMGFSLSECELQAILLIHERYVTLG
eukprot:COSAG01_NODE_4032_length_5416_cov_11.025954_2_plen_66_part_00